MFLLLLPVLLISCTSLNAADQSISDIVRNVYQQIHANPELSHHETQTANLIRELLVQAGYNEFIDAPSLETEVIAVLRTGKTGPVTCLRAELDALAIEEATDLPFKSTVPGVMHACGHDAHAAMLLGAALALKSDVNLTGTVVFLWQPAEEKQGGADDIVNDGILRQLGVERIFAQHVTPGIPAGGAQLTPGPVLAGSNYFKVTVTGKGSHGAFPHEGNDVPVALSTIASGLPTLPARRMNVVPEPCIISIGWIECDTLRVYNQIPATGFFGGTVRAFIDIEDELQNGTSITGMMRTYIENTARAYGCTADFEIARGAPPTVNNESLAERILLQLNENCPDVSVTIGERYMTAEDFAYYTTEFPCLYFRLGISKDDLGNAGLHTNEFTIHPDALKAGTELLIQLARTN